MRNKSRTDPTPTPHIKGTLLLRVSQNINECMDNVKTCRQKVISFALAIDWKANVDCYIREKHMDFIDFKCSLYFQWKTAKPN